MLSLAERVQSAGVGGGGSAGGLDWPGDVACVDALTRPSRSAARDGLDVQVAPEVPFRIVQEVVYSVLDGAGFAACELRVGESSAGRASALRVVSPRDQWMKPYLAALLTPSGFDVESRLRSPPLPNDSDLVGNDCQRGREGLAVFGSDNFTGLLSCTRSLGRAYTSELVGYVSAEASVPAWRLIYAGNILRCGDTRCAGTGGTESERTTVVGMPLDPFRTSETVDTKPLERALEQCYRTELAPHSKQKVHLGAILEMNPTEAPTLRFDPPRSAGFERCVRSDAEPLLRQIATIKKRQTIRIQRSFGDEP